MSSPGPIGPSRRERRSHRRHARWIVVTVVVAVLLIGGIGAALTLGGGDDDDKASSTSSTTEARSDGTSAPGNTATTEAGTPSETAAGRPGGPCKAADVTPAPSGSTIRGANQVTIVVLDNTGGRQCTLNGFPDLKLLGADDKALQATVAQGGGGVPPLYLPRLVTLEPGAKASFAMAWNPVTGSCLDVRSFDITLPDDSKSVNLKTSVSVCGGTMNVSAIQPEVVSP